MGALTEDDIRYFLADKEVSTNSLDLDLEFSPKAIEEAKKRCAGMFNSLPPYSIHVHPGNLSNDYQFFTAGVAYQLYLAKRFELSRSDIDFSAGDVNTNIVAKRLAHINKMLPELREMFEEGARAWKLTANRHDSYGQVG